MRTLLAIGLSMLATPIAADVVIYRTFSAPEIVGDSLVMLSPGEDRVICIDKDGRKRWELPVRNGIGLARLDDRSVRVQDGRDVMRVAIATGKATRIARMARNEAFVIDVPNDLAWSVSLDFHRREFVLRDPRTFRKLWQDDRVDAVETATPDRLLVLTSERHYDEEHGSYTTSDATLRELDRRTGKELWSLPLQDGTSVSAEVARVGHVAVIAERPWSAPVHVLDIDTGNVLNEVKTSDELFRLEASADRIVALARRLNEDFLVTLTLPDLHEETAVPLPARENLFFLRSGDIVVTSGIYSIAAFNVATKSKLWENEQQRLLSHPDGAFIYASYSDRERQRAVVERIDLRTGVETPLYDEPLQPEIGPSAAEVRERQRREERKAAAKKRREAQEARMRLPIGSELCFRFDGSGLVDIREYLHLFPDGKAEYVDADTNSPPRRIIGAWRKVPPDIYEIRDLPLVRDIEAGRLRVDIGVRANVPLVKDLRDAIDAVVLSTAQRTFTRDDIQRLRVGDGRRGVSVFDAEFFSAEPVSREDLVRLVAAMNRYLAAPDHDTLRFRIESYRSYRYASWLEPHSVWKREADEVHGDVDIAIENPNRQPMTFRLAPCSDLTAAFTRLGTIETIDLYGVW